jgi:CHAT domain-containing protein/Tfp pilus assembly protein PilF
MHRYACLFFLLLLFRFPASSQSAKGQPNYQLLYRQAELLFNSPNATATTDKEAIRLYLQVTGILNRGKKYSDTLTDSYLKSGILLLTEDQQEEALQCLHQSVFVLTQNKKLPDSLFFKPYLYIGSIHYSLNELDSAVYYYKKAEAINASHPGIVESERLFNKFGALYFETGDYNKSISYFEKALALVNEKIPVNPFFVINYKNNIATALMKQGKYNQAIEIFRELLKYGNPGDELLYNTGTTYFEKGDYANALKYLRQIRHMDIEKYSSLSRLFIRLQSYDSAQYYLSRAKLVYLNNPDKESKLVYGILLKYSGDLNVASGKIREALKDYQRSIIYLDPSFSDTAIANNPVTFSGLQNFNFLFDAIIAKAAALKTLSGPQQNLSFLKQSLNAYTSALSLVKHIERTYLSDDARLFLKSKVNPAAQDAVDIALRMFNKTNQTGYLNKAFIFAENNKATVLQVGLKNLELTAIPDLPSGLVTEEKKYKTLLARLAVQSEQTKDSGLFAKLQLQMHTTEVALATTQDKLEENPLYHILKFSSSSISMDSLQQHFVEKNQAILSYYYTSSELICFYIVKEGTGYSSIRLRPELFVTISRLRKELQFPEASGRRYLKETGTAIFQELLAPIFDKIKNKERLVIIPFNEISYIPFEMLVNGEDGMLMVKKFAISYNYSASVLSEKRTEKGIHYDVLAMAPFSGTDNQELILPALPATLEEISGLPGLQLSSAEATKSKFNSLSGLFPVLHLATHAVANDSNLLGSYIEFYGIKNDADSMHRLYEQEIYTLDLKSARLVILSACETGNGLLVNGEGVMSLSRAFSYAGCKSVITSLWKADEISTSFICKRLHHYLQKGYAIDVALKNAKIDFLESSEIEDRYKSPAYWAHLVLIGEFNQVTSPGINWMIWLGSLAVVLWITILLVKKRTRHKTMPGPLS